MSKDSTHAEALPVFRQLLDLIEELSEMYAKETDDDDLDDAETMTQQELIDGLIEDAVERGLDEEHAEKVVRSVLNMVTAAARS